MTQTTHTQAARLSPLDRIRRDALTRLGRRPMSAHKLEQALCRRWKDTDAVEQVIADLRSSGLINDQTFAREAIRQELAKAPIAAPALVRRLVSLGVDEPLAQDETRNALADQDPNAGAARLVAHRLSRMSMDLPKATKARRLAGALARRGFDATTIQEAIESALGPF